MSRHWLVTIVLAGLLPTLGGTLITRAQTRPSANPATGSDDPHLVAWWKFDETAGLTAADSSSGGHTGTLEGGLDFEKHSVPGRIGQAIRFDGKGGAVRVQGFKGVTGSKARTVAVWVQTSDPAGELLSWGTNEHGAMWIFGFIRGGLGVTPNGGYLYMKNHVQDNAWHHVAVVVDEASPPNLHDHVHLYFDGAPAVIDDIGLLDLWPIETGDNQDVVIGRRFKGALDDVRIYDRPLSEDEVAVLAGAGARSASSHNR